MTSNESTPPVVDRDAWLAEVAALRVREKEHTRAGDAIAAARRRLPMAEVDPSVPVVGPNGPIPFIDVFEGRQQLIAYYHMWHDGHSAAEQCEGCTFCNGQVRELSVFHSRDVTYATLCQGPYDVSVRYRDFMGWDVPWYSAKDSLDVLLGNPARSLSPVVSYLRQGGRVFETYWTTGRGLEAMTPAYGLLDMTVYGRREWWEDQPEGWPEPRWKDGTNPMRLGSRPIAQWPRIAAGRSDSLEA